MAEVEITGLAETLASLKQIDDDMQVKVLRKALREGAKIIKETAIAQSPVKTGLLRDNIKIRSQTRAKAGIIRATVGVSAKDWTGPAFYASFVLWGHKVGSRKLGSQRKDVPANDFLKRSAATSGEAAASAIIESIGDAVKDFNESAGK